MIPSSPTELRSFVADVLDEATYDTTLTSYVDGIPTVSELVDIPTGAVVLLRGDIDVPIVEGEVTNLTRLESFRATIEVGIERGWRLVVLGHVGRDAANTAEPVARALESLYGIPCPFFPEWSRNGVFAADVADAIGAAPPGSMCLLENTRRYPIERALWDAKARTAPAEASWPWQDAHELAHSLATALQPYYVFDAVSASNPDWSSVVLPAYCDRVAMADGLGEEFRTHVKDVQAANVLIFSGLKMDKLDDLDRLARTGSPKAVLVGGALALPIMAAAGQIDGVPREIGRAGVDTSLKSYVSAERIAQAVEIVSYLRRSGTTLLLPIDFRLESGAVTATLGPDDVQFDVGPETERHFRDVLLSSVTTGDIVYQNGVLGKFEDAEYAGGTRALVALIAKLTKQGARTYIGGGEGLAALLRFGSKSDVTYAFTSGGTILKAVSGRLISYLPAMYATTRS